MENEEREVELQGTSKNYLFNYNSDEEENELTHIEEAENELHTEGLYWGNDG